MSRTGKGSGQQGRERDFLSYESGVVHRTKVVMPQQSSPPPVPENLRCPTCRYVFESADMVELHLQHNPDHRPSSVEVVPRPVSREPATAYTTQQPRCPRCGKEMVLRTARRGPYAGNQFWGCSGYPACKGIVDA
jgi:uncharacterized C2H2 Zn-finger protein